VSRLDPTAADILPVRVHCWLFGWLYYLCTGFSQTEAFPLPGSGNAAYGTT
jgi:hypothetical protein